MSEEFTPTPRPREPTHGELLTAFNMNAVVIQRVETKLDLLLKRDLPELREIIGWCKADEHGDLTGVGMAGDLGRLKLRVDARFNRDDLLLNTWRNRVLGAVSAAIVSSAIIWYVIKPYIERVLDR